MLQSSSRGEIWEGAGDHCLQSRRTHRSQVEATVGRPQCHFLHLYDSSCTWKTIWMTNSSRKETIGRIKRPPPTPVGDAGGHYLQLLSSYLPWVTQIRQPCGSGDQIHPVCVKKTEERHSSHWLYFNSAILPSFLPFFFSTLRSSFEQLKARKLTQSAEQDAAAISARSSVIHFATLGCRTGEHRALSHPAVWHSERGGEKDWSVQGASEGAAEEGNFWMPVCQTYSLRLFLMAGCCAWSYTHVPLPSMAANLCQINKSSHEMSPLLNIPQLLSDAWCYYNIVEAVGDESNSDWKWWSARDPRVGPQQMLRDS